MDTRLEEIARQGYYASQKPTELKQEQRDKLDEDIGKFLASGGSVNEIESHEVPRKTFPCRFKPNGGLINVQVR